MPSPPVPYPSLWGRVEAAQAGPSRQKAKSWAPGYREIRKWDIGSMGFNLGPLVQELCGVGQSLIYSQRLGASCLCDTCMNLEEDQVLSSKLLCVKQLRFLWIQCAQSSNMEVTLPARRFLLLSVNKICNSSLVLTLCDIA